MNHSSRVKSALNFATKVHLGQKRKGKDIEYISHPIVVSKILETVTQNEDVIIAGLLHDTIEDCEPYGSVTKEDIESMFGEEVAQMVDSVTEQDKTLSWKKRKEAALKKLRYMSHDSLLVKSADVLHNLSDLNKDLLEDGLSVFEHFNASAEAIEERYAELIEKLRIFWAKNPLLPLLEKEFDLFQKLVGHYDRKNRTFTFYKTYEWEDVQYGVQPGIWNVIGETTARSLYTDNPRYHPIEAEYLRLRGNTIDESEASDFIRQFAEDIRTGKVDISRLFDKKSQ